MTDTTNPSSPLVSRRLIGFSTLVAVALSLFLIWYFALRDNAPASVTSEAAEEARDEALAVAGGEQVEGMEGTWTVDTTVGTFDRACLTEVCNATFVGFRIDEELVRIGAKTVVGRTPGVTGSMTIDGTTITDVEIVADMTGLITDDDNRTMAIRRQAIETDAFPEATFSLTEPIELDSLPAAGERIAVDATGALTIHGVTRTETVSLMAEFDGTRILVFGELGPILLADYDIDKPSAAVVLSVEDNALMELQLFFSKA